MQAGPPVRRGPRLRYAVARDSPTAWAAKVTPAPGPPPAPPPSALALVLVARRVERDPQQLGDFSLDLDDLLGLAQAAAQAVVVGAQPGDLPVLGLRAGTAPALGQGLEAPASRWRRQSTRWEEYRPSRRSRAPICPGSVAVSASFRIASLYSAVNLRRLGRSGTSGSGGTRPSCPLGALVISAVDISAVSFPALEWLLSSGKSSHVMLAEREDPKPLLTSASCSGRFPSDPQRFRVRRGTDAGQIVATEDHNDPDRSRDEALSGVSTDPGRRCVHEFVAGPDRGRSLGSLGLRFDRLASSAPGAVTRLSADSWSPNRAWVSLPGRGQVIVVSHSTDRKAGLPW